MFQKNAVLRQANRLCQVPDDSPIGGAINRRCYDPDMDDIVVPPSVVVRTSSWMHTHDQARRGLGPNRYTFRHAARAARSR